MKRVSAIILALVMLFSLCITASAEETNNGSITITNATIGQTYRLYKFFNAAYAVDKDGNLILDANGKATVAYTIQPGDPFYTAMFGDGTAVNPYFDYVKDTGVVTKKNGVADADVIIYLDGLAQAGSPIKTEIATTSEVEFSNLATGYYLVDKGVDSAVTITTNMPDVEIIDKNQIPGTGFDKVVDKILNNAGQEHSNTESASVGNEIYWNINFAATNYHEDEIVEYYIIRDNKSSSVWVEFDDISVTVYQKDATGDNKINEEDIAALVGNTDENNGVTELKRGYYHLVNQAIATDPAEWDFIGDWSGVEKKAENAQWFLIHYGYDEFAIVIPWLDDFDFIGGETSYELNFDLVDQKDENDILSEPIYEPNTFVQVSYFGVVGPYAPTTGIRNSVTLEWVTDETSHGPEDPETTETKIYNLGITKTANDGVNSRLANAVFGLYTDAECTNPINVIPTNNKGVYILDDLMADVSGEKRISTREMYEKWLTSEYVDSEGNAIQSNKVITPESGQVVVLGLAAGTYYIKEIEAPSGYNKLPNATAINVGTGTLTNYNNNYKGLDNDEDDTNNPDITYNAYGTTIQNSKGVELPSTGGTGTMKMIAIGTAVALAFAVLLITHKKMSIYHD